MSYKKLFTAIVSISLSAPACGHFISQNATTFAEHTDRSIGCAAQFEDGFWDSLYGFALKKEDFISRGEMRVALRQTFEGGRLKNLKSHEKEHLIDMISDLYELLSSKALHTLGVEKSKSEKVLEALTNLEMGDRSSPEKARVQTAIRKKFDEINTYVSKFSLSSECEPEISPTPPISQAYNLVEYWRQSRHPVVFGGLKAFANSYQSCDATSVPPLSAATSDIQGISITGLHPDGVGNKRIISDLDTLVKSHPYLEKYVRPSSSCHGILKAPMIYDYGGKPYATNATDSSLDFFRDAGSGTPVLGIDCSGYVYSALATAGLKLKKSGRLKAINVMGVPARMYMNPQANGLTCLDFVTFSRSRGLRTGDILASGGHVVIIDEVGADPFGIAWITSEANCKPENIDISKFDFTILHSSPVKGAIGINRIQASHYFSDGGAMALALTRHAVNACLAKVKNISVTTRSTDASLIRHLNTAECKDQPIRLAREECLNSCKPPSVHISSHNRTPASDQQKP